MDIQQIFYALGSVALGLFIIFFIVGIAAGVRVFRLVRLAQVRLNSTTRQVSDFLQETGKAWGVAAVTSLVVRYLTKLIKRRLL